MLAFELLRCPCILSRGQPELFLFLSRPKLPCHSSPEEHHNNMGHTAGGNRDVLPALPGRDRKKERVLVGALAGEGRFGMRAACFAVEEARLNN